MDTTKYNSTDQSVQGTVVMYLLKNWLDSLSNAIVIIPLEVNDTPKPAVDVPQQDERESDDA